MSVKSLQRLPPSVKSSPHRHENLKDLSQSQNSSRSRNRNLSLPRLQSESLSLLAKQKDLQIRLNSLHLLQKPLSSEQSRTNRLLHRFLNALLKRPSRVRLFPLQMQSCRQAFLLLACLLLANLRRRQESRVRQEQASLRHCSIHRTVFC